MGEPETVENFYGVYLLYNINPKYKGRTYIGYTRDPNRRIMQHNRGTWAGGAHKTSKRGPWKMVMIVHGFPNNISALRFEWAWQNPNKTTRLQHLDLKKMPRKETEFQFKLRVVSEMLRVGPWYRFPLVIRWLENDYRQEFPTERKPPDHMIICQGPVKSYNRKRCRDITSVSNIECKLCSGYLKETEKLTCTNANCNLVSHVICLANLFLPPGEFVPINGFCPLCNTKLMWGDLIRKMNGYGQRVDRGDDDRGSCDDGYIRGNDDSTEEDCDDNEEMSSQDKVFVDNFDDCDDDDDDVICTQDDVFIKGDHSDSDEVVFKQNKVYDDHPSWFLDCNEDL